MDFHVSTPESVELVMQVIDGQLIIVPPVAEADQSHASSPSCSTMLE